MKKLNKTEKIQMCLNVLFDMCFYDDEFKKCFNEYASKFELDDDVIIELLESNYDKIPEEIMEKLEDSTTYMSKYIDSRKNSNNSNNSEKSENINMI